MNTKERFLKVKAIFQDAMELPASDRKLYVAHACESDSELRREVEQLLNDEQAEAFSQAIRNQVGQIESDRPVSKPIPSLVGKTLDGRYRLEALIGEGGMGSVYRAVDTKLGRVAVKVLPPHLSSSPDYVDRFLREGQAGRLIQHPNVVTVYDIGTTTDGISYMVMEYIEGQSLSALLKNRKRFTPMEAVKVLEPVASALHVAHTKGIIHRDVKPANIMVSTLPDGNHLVKLLDLGIAKVQDSTTLTVIGSSMGTPQYMAPEQWGIVPADGNTQIDRRADIYSLGIVFFEMVTGRRPFEGDTTQVLFNQHQHVVPPRLHDLDPTIPPEVSQVIERTLAKDRKDRPANCETWMKELSQAVNIKVSSKVAKPKPEPVTASNDSHPTDSSNSPKTPLAPTIAATPSSVLKDTVAAIEVEYSPPSLPISIPTQRKSGERLGRREIWGWVLLTFIAGIGAMVGIGLLTNKESKSSPPTVTNSNTGETSQQIPKSADYTNKLGMELMLISPGSFEMGGDKEKDEKPVHTVTIKQPFYLGKYEVTQAQWVAVMGTNPSNFKGNDLPVENVSWDEVQKFIKKLNEQEGVNVYRLPTEAEWEYACRAGTKGDYAGDLDSMGWYYENSGDNRLSDANWKIDDLTSNHCRTHPVGQKSPNAWGLYDMHGNVWEWCQDCYGSYPQNSVTDPPGPSTGSNRVYRGGSWNDYAACCRSAYRYNLTPDYRYHALGFRLLRTVK